MQSLLVCLAVEHLLLVTVAWETHCNKKCLFSENTQLLKTLRENHFLCYKHWASGDERERVRNFNSTEYCVVKRVRRKSNSTVQARPATSNTVTELLQQRKQELCVFFHLCTPSLCFVLHQPLVTQIYCFHSLRYACSVCTAGMWLSRGQHRQFPLHSHPKIRWLQALVTCHGQGHSVCR